MLARPGPEREKTPAKWKAGPQLILSNLPQHSPMRTVSTQASPLYLISQTPTRKTANNFLYFKPSEFDARNLSHKGQKRLIGQPGDRVALRGQQQQEANAIPRP